MRSYFSSFAGINIAGLSLREVIMQWWRGKCRSDSKPYYRALPSIIIWELWKRRNGIKYEGKGISIPRIIHNVSRNMYMLIKLRRPSMQCSGRWENIFQELEEYSTRVNIELVRWECPHKGWVKYNTDGDYRGNPRFSSYAFCLRDDKGGYYTCRGIKY
uniref:Putative ovule protein n=1 Tax=Solanum chacoense TaxID=4108 RepID=A0A0V0I9P3_SOLCH